MTEAIYSSAFRSQSRAKSAVTIASSPERAPFRWTRRELTTLPVETRGTLPAWLSGQLMRTAPALFQSDAGWRAGHLFDAQGLMYSFEFADGKVRFDQRLLQSRALELAQQGKDKIASFGTPMKRSLLQRLFQPMPPVTDNANVNVVPWQGQWLALTETPFQHVIGRDAASRGLYKYHDGLSRSMSMTAHPHYDFEGNAMVNVGTKFGPKTELTVFRQSPNQNVRTVEGKIELERVPYLHDFGVTARHVVLIDHPLRVSALSLVWRDRPYIDGFKWQPETGTKLRLFDRRRGTWQSYETEALFCFHVVNTFEDGEDVVLDFCAYDDAKIIDQVRTDSLARGAVPNLVPRYVRARLRPDAKRVELELLSTQRFEFPSISYARVHGRAYDVAWGAAITGTSYESEIVRVSTSQPEVPTFRERGMTYGEPVFVGAPGAQDPNDGVLLTVGSHLDEDRSTLAVLDATTLAPLAHCDVGLALPLGFHGSFQPSR